jgi:hypothetical protein
MNYIGKAVVDKVIALIPRKDEFPLRTKDKITDLIRIYGRKLDNGGVYGIRTFHSILMNINVYDRSTKNKIIALAEEILTHTEDDIHDMLCDNDIFNDTFYRGLDDERDTEEQVEIAIRFFPDVLTEAKLSKTNEWLYPIQYLASVRNAEIGNGKAVSFIPLLARLAIEWMVEYRGGLLLEDRWGCNVLHYLSQKPTYTSDRFTLTDDKYFQVLVQLRKMGLLKKEDIVRGSQLLVKYNFTFPKKTSQFFIEWDPVALLHTYRYGHSPLHFASNLNHISIQRFQMVFEYGILYYPKKLGICLLFKKDVQGKTPYQIACGEELEQPREEVIDAVESTLLQFQQRRHLLNDGNSNNNNINNAGPYNVIDALLTAATDEKIHLDCVYFLLRREPDVLQKLLAMEDNDDINNNNDIGGDGENSADGNDDEDHGSDSNHVGEKDDSSNDDDDDEDGSKNHVGGGGIRISNNNNNSSSSSSSSNTVNRLHRHQNNCMVSAADGNGKGKGKRKRNTNNNGTK